MPILEELTELEETALNIIICGKQLLKVQGVGKRDVSDSYSDLILGIIFL